MKNLKYGIIETDFIYHEGDERSRTHPGHGYPAYTETVTNLREFSAKESWERHVTGEAKRGRKCRAIVFEEVEVEVTAEIKIGTL